MSSPDSTNTDKQENVHVTRDEQEEEEEKPIPLSSAIEDNNNESKKMRATTDDDNQIFVSMIVIANIQHKRIHKNVHRKY